MTLFRLFPLLPEAGPSDPGGPLHVPRLDQGGGRHDNPALYGALYLSRNPVSPVAERLKGMRGATLSNGYLVREGARLALVALDEAGLVDLLDLDEPRSLVGRSLRPSTVATGNRGVTQSLARRLYEEGVPGFEWWSTIEASWINVTLFADRVRGRLEARRRPEPLTLDHPTVREAARAVGVLLPTARRGPSPG